MADATRKTLAIKTAGTAAPVMPPAAKAETDPLARQRRYVEREKRRGGGLGLLFAEAFIRGMREIGYKNPAWALAEMIDNSFQAGANTVEVQMRDVDLQNERSKPSQIAVVDNGIGMIPEMISHAVRWGGTDRENNRQGFGRYGYGLPSSAVSLARRYAVYSKVDGDQWHAVTVDLDQLGPVAGDTAKVDKLLEAKPATPPSWLESADARIDVRTANSGTIVVLEDLDRLQTMSGWVSGKGLQMKLLQHFGVIYRHSLKDKAILVAGVKTEVIDPLFLLPDARFADETTIRAKKVNTAAFEVEGGQGKGVVRIRASVLPPNFQLADPAQYDVKGAKMARRWDYMRQYNGILVCRAGRQIDVVQTPWTKFQNYDANIKIEVDFDPVLDEFFGLTTSKQQIVIDERMWEKLKQSGKANGCLETLVKEMRAEFKRMRSELKAAKPQAPDEEKPRASVVAMEAAEKFKPRSSALSPQKAALAEKALAEFAQSLAIERNLNAEDATAAARHETRRPFEVEFAAREEAPMYQAKRLGTQKRLSINTSHPFFEKIYELAGDAQAGLEVLLFVLADHELDSDGEREAFYRNERALWSEGLRHALDALVTDEALHDRASAASEDA